MQRLTKEQAIIISGYTGVLCCEHFSELHKDIEQRIGQSIGTIGLGMISKENYQKMYKKDFMNLVYKGINNMVLSLPALIELEISQILKDNNHDVFWQFVKRDNEYIFICNSMDAVTFKLIFKIIQKEYPEIEHIMCQLGK